MTNRSGPRSFVAAITATLLVSLPARAMQDAAPVISTSSVTRSASTIADWTYEGQYQSKKDSADSTSNGAFVRRLQSDIAYIQGAESSGSVSHHSTISAFQIKGQAQCRSDATGPDTDFYIVGASNTAEFEARFTVPVDTTATFSSRVEADGSGTATFVGGSYTARIEFTGTRADGTTFRFYTFRGSGVSLGPDEYFELVELKANSELLLKWKLTATATEGFPGTEFAEGALAFELNLGDTDGDGLLDAWETDGIDVNSDGVPEIDLPAMGADPNKKNLFVELDAQAGVRVDLNAVLMVEQAFADAPGSMVDNPDGSDGILLLFLVDDVDLPNTVFGVANNFADGFDAQKATRFGPEPLRTHPDWSDKIEPAYELIFRYCIWGQDITKADGSSFSGISELPGNDFFIAAGAVSSWYAVPSERTQALAGTLMHEFGHALSLRHGGQENSPNYKPNYLSVMNYTYQMPWTQTTVEGTRLSDYFFLDYARTAGSVLTENALDEDDGYDGPADRKMIFNTSPAGTAPRLQVADADAAEIDWNLSGAPIETSPVAVDISRFQRNTGDVDTYDASLIAFTDWDRIWYHLSGSSDFADGSHVSSAEIEPFTFDDFTAINSYAADDRTTQACPADLNGDGIVDLGDIQSFIALFLVQDLAVDFNADGIVDLGDIQVFIADFLEGC